MKTTSGDAGASPNTSMCQMRQIDFMLSMLAATNLPARKQKSNLDVLLPAGIQDEDYLR